MYESLVLDALLPLEVDAVGRNRVEAWTPTRQGRVGVDAVASSCRLLLGIACDHIICSSLAVPTTGDENFAQFTGYIKQGNEKAVLCWYQSSSDSSKEFV